MDRVTIRQTTTGKLLRFEPNDQTTLAIDDYLWLTGLKPDYSCALVVLTALVTLLRQFAQLVHEWVASIDSIPRNLARFPALHESGANLPADWESQSDSTLARPFQDRKRRSPSRHRVR